MDLGTRYVGVLREAVAPEGRRRHLFPRRLGAGRLAACNPAWGHCDITALVVNDIFGGDLMVGDVRGPDGEQHGFHWWNHLAGGAELDLTREQFHDGQVIGVGRIVERPAGRLPRRWEEYQLLRERVETWLGPLPAR